MNWNVLLVDDEEEFVTTLAERLELRGMAVRTALDGESALMMIDESPPDIVVLDLLMPGIGGLELLPRIKKKYPKTHVILLTGHGATKEGIEGMKHGAFDYLMKPVSIEELTLKMKDAMGADQR